MGTVTVIYGHAYDGKQIEALEACFDFMRRNQGNHCLYLVRSDVRVQQLRRRVLHEVGGCFHFPVVTLPDLIKQLYRQSLGARREISALEQVVLIEEIFRQRAAEAGPQFCFQRFGEQHGILKKVQDFLVIMRRYGLATPRHLEERFRQCSPRRRPLYDELIRILSLYTTRLDELRIIDETGIFLEMARRAEADELNLERLVASPDLLVLEGYYELTPPEQQIFSALCRQFDRSVMTVDSTLNPYALHDAATTPKPFRIFQDLFQYIRYAGFSVQQHSNARQTSHNDARLTFIEDIFHTGRDAVEASHPSLSSQQPADHSEARAAEKSSAADLLTVSAYRNKTEEVTAIAREIRRLVQQQPDLELRDIGVTFPVVEQYDHVIYEIFPRFGIPFTLVRGRSLASSPVVIAIFRLLEVVLEEYNRDVLTKLLMSPYVAFTPEASEENSASPPVTLDAESVPFLDSLARLQGIIKGKAAWQETLTHHLESLREHHQNPTAACHETSLEEDADRPEDAGKQSDPFLSDTDIALLSGLLPTLIELFKTFNELETDTPCSIAEWVQKLSRCIKRCQIPGRLLQAPERKLRELDAAAFQKIMQVLETLQRHAPVSTRLSLQAFYDLLWRAVHQETYYAPEWVDDAVWVMGHLDTRHVRFCYVFFGGLVERDFPGRADPNIFLSDQEIEVFGLPTYATRVQETDHLFYANLLNATRHLYLSYPAQEGDTDLLKAVYLENILRWQQKHAGSLETAPEAPVSIQRSDKASPGFGWQRAGDLSLEQIFTVTDLLRWLGATRLRPGDDAFLVEAVLRWLVEKRGPQWGHCFLKGLQAYRMRQTHELGRFDGVLTSAWAQRVLRRRYDRHLYSASEFDLYARCPIRFFFQRLLQLAALPEKPQEIQAQEIGNLLHRIVYRFYGEPAATQPHGREGNVDAAFLQRRRNQADWLLEAKARLDQIIRAELARYEFSGVFWERFTTMLLGGLTAETTHDGKHGLFETFLEQEAHDDDVLIPWFVNANFGFADPEADGYPLSESPLRVTVPNGGKSSVTVAIRGQIDRIDVERETEADIRRAVVYDYKTGALRPIKKIYAGLSFQLPLYLLAAQEFLGNRYQVVAGGYYHLKSPTEVGKKAYLGSKEAAQYLQGSPRGLLESHDEFLKVLEQCQTRVIRAAEAIRNGEFHPATSGPQEAGCSYCPYQQICRVDHQRMRAIDADKDHPPEF